MILRRTVKAGPERLIDVLNSVGNVLDWPPTHRSFPTAMSKTSRPGCMLPGAGLWGVLTLSGYRNVARKAEPTNIGGEVAISRCLETSV
jgi:hypothetical protein